LGGVGALAPARGADGTGVVSEYCGLLLPPFLSSLPL
jgi:hypothetical protein